MDDMTSEIPTHDAVPSMSIELIEFILNVVRNLFLLFVLLHGRECNIYNLFQVILIHIGSFDAGFHLFRHCEVTFILINQQFKTNVNCYI